MSPWEEVEKDPEFSTLAPQDKAALFDDWHRTTVEEFHKDLDPEQIDSAGMRGFLASGQAKRRELLGEPVAPEQAVKEFDQSLQARSKAQQQTLNDYDELEKSRFALKDAAMARGVTSSEDRGMPMNPRVAAILDKPQQEAQAKLDELSSRFTPEIEKQAKEARGALRGERPAAVLGSDIYTDPSLVLDKEKYRQAIQSTNASPEAKLLALADYNTRRDDFAKKALNTFNVAGESPVPGMTSFSKWESEQPADVRAKTPEAKALDYMRAMQDRSGFRKLVSAVGTGAIQGGADVAGQGIGLAAMASGSDALAKKAGEVEQGTQALSDVQKLEGDNTATGATTAGGISRLGVGMAPAIGAGVLTGGSLTAAALAAGAQTAGAQFPTTYNAMIEQGKTPEEALSASRGAAVLSGGITAALTALGGYNGVEALVRRGGMEAARSKLKSVLLTGPLKEIAEELPDEQASQIIESSLTNPDKPVSQVVDEFMAKAPDLALQVGLLGGAGEAFSKQGAPATPAVPAEQQRTPVNSAGLGRTVGEVIAEADALKAKAQQQAVESGSPMLAQAIAENVAAPTPVVQQAEETGTAEPNSKQESGAAGQTTEPLSDTEVKATNAGVPDERVRQAFAIAEKVAAPTPEAQTEETGKTAEPRSLQEPGAAGQTTEPLPEQEVKATTEQVRPTTHRVFEGGSPIRRTGEGVLHATDENSAFRLTGEPQIEDMIRSGEVRAREGKIKGGRSGEVHWSRGHESLGYSPREGAYVLQTNATNLNQRQNGLPLSEVTVKQFQNGQWVDVSDQIRQKAQQVSPVTINNAALFQQGGVDQHAGESRTPAEGSISDVTTGKVADNKSLSTINPEVQGVVTLQPEQLAALTPNPAEIEQAITDNQTPAREAMDLNTADPIMVIRQKDGTLKVAQGHHRLARALRDGVPLRADIQNEASTKPLKSIPDRINESALSPRTTYPTLVQDIKALTGNTASKLQEVADALLPEPMTGPTAEKIARRLMEDNAVQREAGAARERALERDLIGEEKAQRGDERPVSDDKAPVTQGDFVTWQDENGAMREGVLTKTSAGRGSLGEPVSEVTLEDSQTVLVPRRELQPLMASSRGNPVQASRAEAIESLRGHLGKEVSVGVSAVDAINGAAELQGDVPGVQKAWVGTSDEFLADEGLRKAFPQVNQAMTSPDSSRFEGLFSGGRAFVFTDNVGIYEADIESAEQGGMSPGQAAVQRVITHEALVHRGFYALDKPTRRALLRWGEQNIYEGEMDAKAEEYGVGANWRSDVGSREWLMEEIMAKMIERLKAPPKSGPLKQLWDILASLWRKLTGRSREVTLKDIHDVAKLLRTALELAENNIQTRDGMPIRVEVAKPSMRDRAISRVEKSLHEVERVAKDRLGINLSLMDRAIPAMKYTSSNVPGLKAFAPEIADLTELGYINKQLGSKMSEAAGSTLLDVVGTDEEKPAWNDLDAVFRNAARADLEKRLSLVQKVSDQTKGLYSQPEILEIADDIYAGLNAALFANESVINFSIEVVKPSMAGERGALDAEYMAAVESGDVAKQQAMVDVAAKAAGYETEAWHSTRSKDKINTFNTRSKSMNSLGILGEMEVTREAAFFTANEAFADAFGGSVSKYFLNTDEVYDATKYVQERSIRERFMDWLGPNVPSKDPESGLDLSDKAKYAHHLWQFFDGELGEKFREFLTEEGITGVKFEESTEDAKTGDDVEGTTIAVFDPNQIKSADPITRDANGNVIPLSQRFNTESNDIRFSIRPTYTSPLDQTLANTAKAVRLMRDGPPAVPVNLQEVYRKAQVGKSSAMVSLDDMFAEAKKTHPDITEAEFGQQVQALYDDNGAYIEPAESPTVMREAGEKYNVRTQGVPASYVMVLSDVPVRASMRPEQDAEYMQAVKDGDVAKQQAMVDAAAKAAGYKMKEVFHGSLNAFNTFDKSKSRNALGFHFAQSMDQVIGPLSRFSNTDTSKVKIIKAYLKANSPLELFDRGSWDGVNTIKEINDKTGLDIKEGVSQNEIVSAIKSAGYDSVDYENQHEGEEGGRATIVFEPNQIKSADPITRDADGNVVPLSQRFNTETNDIRFSLAPDTASRLNRVVEAAQTASGDITESVQTPIKDRPVHTFAQQSGEARVDAAVQIVDALEAEGTPNEELVDKLNSYELQKQLGIEKDPDMLSILMAEAMRRGAPGAFDAYEVTRERAGRALGSGAMIHSHPRYQHLFVLNGIKKEHQQQANDIAEANADIKADEVKKLDAESGRTAAQELSESAEEAMFRAGEEALSKENKTLWQKAKDLITRIGASMQILAARKAKNGAETKPSVRGTITQADLDALNKMSDADLMASIEKDQKALRGMLKDLTRSKADGGTTSRRVATLVNRLSEQLGVPTDITSAVEALTASQDSLKNQFEQSIVDSLVGKVRSAITPKKAPSKNLNSVIKQITRILADNLNLPKATGSTESLGEKAIDAFGRVRNNEQLIREAWDKAREQIRVTLAKRATEGLEGLTEEEAADIEQQLDDQLAAIAAEVPAHLWARGQAFSVLRDALAETAFDNNEKIMDNPEGALKAAQDKINEAVEKVGNVDPARWESNQPYIIAAFNQLVADLRAAKAKSNARRRAAQRAGVFSPAETETFNRLMDSARKRSGDKTPLLPENISWGKLFSSSPQSQEAKAKAMMEYMKADPVLSNLTAAEQQELADMFAKQWEAKRTALTEAKVAAVLKRRHATAKGKEAVKGAIPKFIQAINRGELNNDIIAQDIAEKFGFQKLTDDENKKLETLAKELQQPDIPVHERRAKTDEIVKIIARKTGLSTAEILSAWWVTSVLSGPRTIFTIGLAFLSGGFEVFTHAMATVINAHLQGRRSEGTDAAMQSITNYFKSYPRAVQLAWQYVRTGDKNLLADSDPAFMQFFDTGRNNPQSIGWRMTQSKNPATRTLGRFMHFFEKMLTAGDLFNSTITRHGMLPVAQFLNSKTYEKARVASETDLANYRKKALNTWWGDEEPKTWQEQALVTRQSIDLIEAKLAKYANVLEDANFVAAQGAMTLNPEGLGGKGYRAIRGIANRAETSSAKAVKNADKLKAEEVGALNKKTQQAIAFLYHFATHQMLNLGGLRFARFAGNKLNQSLGFVPLLGLARLYEKDYAGQIKSQAIIKNQVIGAILSMVGIIILKAVSDEPDDEKRGWGIEGSWAGLSADKIKQLMAAGRKQNSIHFGEHTFNYSNWPISSVLAAFGAMADRIKYNPKDWKEATSPEVAYTGLWAAMTSTFDTTALSQLSEILGSNVHSRDPVDASIKKVSRVFGNFAGGFVPRIIKDIDLMQDGKLRKYEGWENFAKEIPIYRRYVGGPLLDIFGKQVEVSRTPWSREYLAQPEAREYRLLGQLGSNGLWLTPADPANRRVGRGKRSREMTDAEQKRFVTIVGNNYRDLVLKHGERLTKMPHENAKELMGKLSAAARDRAERAALVAPATQP